MFYNCFLNKFFKVKNKIYEEATITLRYQNASSSGKAE